MNTLGSDPRGPKQPITAIDRQSDGTYVTLECGHVRQFNQIFTYSIGELANCLQCGEEIRREAKAWGELI